MINFRIRCDPGSDKMPDKIKTEQSYPRMAPDKNVKFEAK